MKKSRALPTPHSFRALLLTLLFAAFGSLPAFGLPNCPPDSLQRLYDHYTVHARASDPTTVGIELEGSVPKSLGRKGAAKLVLERLRARYPGAKLKGDLLGRQFEIKYERGGHKYTWLITDDRTIQTPDERIELVSPVLRDQGDIDLYMEMVTLLRGHGFKDLPDSAGVHVHTGLPDITGPELAALVEAFARVEKTVMHHFGMTPSRKRWAREVPPEVRKYIAEAAVDQPTVPSVLESFIVSKTLREKVQAALGLPYLARYQAFNTRAYLRHKTGETRLFNSTVNPDEIRVMVKFSTSLVEKIRSKDTALLDYLVRTPSEQVDIGELTRLLGLDVGQTLPILENMLKKQIERANQVKLPEPPDGDGGVSSAIREAARRLIWMTAFGAGMGSLLEEEET
jgi:hypothetical protein